MRGDEGNADLPQEKMNQNPTPGNKKLSYSGYCDDARDPHGIIDSTEHAAAAESHLQVQDWTSNTSEQTTPSSTSAFVTFKQPPPVLEAFFWDYLCSDIHHLLHIYQKNFLPS